MHQLRVLALGLLLLGAARPPQAAPVFQESGGIVVIEIESTPTVPDWALEASVGGYAGSSYYTWRGPNLYNSPGSGVLLYQFNIANPGRYTLAVHNRPDNQFNGCFVRMDGTGGTFPGGWWRAFFSTPGNTWGWLTNFDTGTSHPVPVFDLAAGIHTLEFSGRDAGVSLDRFHLYLPTVASPLDTTRPPSAVMGGGPPPPSPAPPPTSTGGTGSRGNSGRNDNLAHRCGCSSIGGTFGGLIGTLVAFALGRVGFPCRSGLKRR